MIQRSVSNGRKFTGTYNGTASGEGYALKDGTPINLSDKDQKWLGITDHLRREKLKW